jgi:hypothetical protein
MSILVAISGVGGRSVSFWDLLSRIRAVPMGGHDTSNFV